MSRVELDITANGTQIFDRTFTSAAAAVAFFQNHPLDLGSLASLGGGGTITLDISLAETLSKAGSGFSGRFIIGDPPPAPMTAASREASAPSLMSALGHSLFDSAFGGSPSSATDWTILHPDPANLMQLVAGGAPRHAG